MIMALFSKFFEYMNLKKVFVNMVKPCTCLQEGNLQVRFGWNQFLKMS